MSVQNTGANKLIRVLYVCHGVSGGAITKWLVDVLQHIDHYLVTGYMLCSY